MGRTRGKPAYRGKTEATSVILQPVALMKSQAAEKRTGKSRSDVVNHCLLKEADNITKKTFEKLAAAAE